MAMLTPRDGPLPILLFTRQLPTYLSNLQEHEAYQRKQRERHLRRQARRLAKQQGRGLESSPSGLSAASLGSSDPGSSQPSPRAGANSAIGT